MDAIFSYSDIVTINFKGIYCKNERDECHILFEECRKNFAFENSLKNSKCVATRNIEKGEFTFFTTPKIKIFFKNKKRFLFKPPSYVNDFHALQNQIFLLGFTTYDLT